MSIFGKKKDEEVPAVETQNEAEPTTDSQETPTAEETPEQKRDRLAVKLEITFHPDTRDLTVRNAQNLTRELAEYMVARVHTSYDTDRLANAVVVRFAEIMDKADKSKRIYVPGQK